MNRELIGTRPVYIHHFQRKEGYMSRTLGDPYNHKKILRIHFDALDKLEQGNLIDSHKRGVEYLCGHKAIHFTQDGLG